MFHKTVMYRGISEVTKKFVYGYFYCDENGDYFILRNKGCTSDIINKDYVKIIPCTLGEFIGAFTISGKRIFEGDVLNGVYEGLAIGWCEHCCSYQFFTLEDSECFGCEGNIRFFDDYLADDEYYKKSDVVGSIHDFYFKEGEKC